MVYKDILFAVPRAGIEPAPLTELDLKSSASTNSATRACSEVAVGIEPTYKGFADPCLTTWPRDPTSKDSGILAFFRKYESSI